MSDATATLIVLAVLIGVLLLVQTTRIVRAWWRLRAPRLVTCPETEAPAAVTINATGTLLTSAFGGPFVWLSACSRWPSRRLCGQECLPQIKAAPDDTRVDTIARRWFAGKTCVYCRQTITETKIGPHRPALLRPDGSTIEWANVPAECLPAAFQTHVVVCWNCHIAETFRRTHPELVTDRQRPPR
jgi:hypothetical protein